ncbi:MAG: branched-chain amino acid transaminase [Myxococcota bacterium]|nr:branched-chain amino acid transaminase [Myxococcota bacterium]
MDKVEYIWMDGELRPWDAAQVHVLSHGLHYGLGAFEGIRAYEQSRGGVSIFRLEDHLKRLLQSAHICMMDVPFTLEQWSAACCELIKANGFSDGCYLRPTVFTGAGSLGIAALDNPIHCVVAAWRWGAYLGEEGLKNGIRMMVSSHRRPAGDAYSPKGKINGQYVGSILAKREAIRSGFDEAMMLDHQGFAVEGTGENLFVVKDGEIRTPHIGQSILAGITRETAIAILEDQGMVTKEGPITRDELYCADEVFLTGTAAEVTPVREIDHRKIGAGRPGEITTMLQAAYGSVVRGEKNKWSHWHTLVE